MVAACEQRGHGTAVICSNGVADQVDTAVDLVEAPAGEAKLDLAAAHARRQQLPSRHHPVLAARQPRDVLIRTLSERLGTHTVPNSALDAGAPLSRSR